MKKVITALLAAAMLVMNVNIAFAVGKDDMTSKFYLSEVGYPAEVIKYINGDSFKSLNGGPVVYGEAAANLIDEDGNALSFGYWQKAVKPTGNAFDKAIPYMCYGVEGSTTTSGNNNQIRLKLNAPKTVEQGDGLYASFYYRAAESFNGVGAKSEVEYTGAQTQLNLYAFDNQTQNTAVISDTQLSTLMNTSKVTVVPDGEWHKLDVMINMNATNFAKMSNKDVLNLAINMNQIYDPIYIEFAGFNCGVLKPGESFDTNRLYTEMSWHLSKCNSSAISVNGTALDLSGESSEFTVPGTMDTPTAVVTSDDGVTYRMEKLAYNRYKLTTYAGAYDVVKAPTQNVLLRERFNNGAFSGNWLFRQYQNSALVGNTYYLNIKLDDSFKMYPLVDTNERVVHGCDNQWRNEWAEYTLYNRSEEAWADETVFKKGYSLNLLKPENPVQPASNGGFNCIQAMFDLGDDTITTGDVVYYSFYIKSNAVARFVPRMLGKDIKNSTEDNPITIGRNGILTIGRKFAANEIKNASTNHLVNVYDQWIKYVGWYRVTEDCVIADNVKLGLWFNLFAFADYSAANIRMSDFKCGVMRGYEVKSASVGNEIATAINKALFENINVYTFSAGGAAVEPVGLAAEVSASRPLPEITVDAYHGNIPVEITKTSAGNRLPATYQIRAYSDAYDRTLPETATLSYGFLYREPVLGTDGNYTTPNRDITTKKNSDFVKTYTLTVDRTADYSDYVFSIDGEKVTDYSNLMGAKASFEGVFDKFANQDRYTMILAAYDASGVLKSVKSMDYTYAEGETDSFVKATVDADSEANLSFKVFLWDSLSGLNPLDNGFEINTDGMIER